MMKPYETEHYGQRETWLWLWYRKNLNVRAYRRNFYSLKTDKKRYFLHDKPIKEVEVRYMNEFCYAYRPDFPSW
jgi:hypothetical protein